LQQPKKPKKPKKYRKLTFADAQAVRAAREQNPALTLAELAAKFGTTRMSISRVLRGEVPPGRKGAEAAPRGHSKTPLLGADGHLDPRGLGGAVRPLPRQGVAYRQRPALRGRTAQRRGTGADCPPGGDCRDGRARVRSADGEYPARIRGPPEARNSPRHWTEARTGGPSQGVHSDALARFATAPARLHFHYTNNSQ